MCYIENYSHTGLSYKQHQKIETFLNAYPIKVKYKLECHGLLDRYIKSQVAHAPGMSRTFSPPPRVSDPDMHHGTCVTHVPWCMPGLLTSGFLWSRWRGKHSQHPRCVRNPQFCVSVKEPARITGSTLWWNQWMPGALIIQYLTKKTSYQVCLSVQDLLRILFVEYVPLRFVCLLLSKIRGIFVMYIRVVICYLFINICYKFVFVNDCKIFIGT